MKVLVAVKEIESVGDAFEIEDGAVAGEFVEYELNEWDEYAVEEAVQIREAEEDEVEVVTVTIGPERAEETIRMGLAKGADRAIRVWDDAIADQELLDAAAKARLLAAVVEDEEPDLVLSGVQAGDDAFGATGVSLAEAIGFEWAAVVNGLSLDVDAGVAHVKRELEGGVQELTDVELPAVLSIQTGINEPRYASLRGIRMAQSKEIAAKSVADLGLEAASVESELVLVEMRKPESESDTQFFEGGADEQAGTLASVLRERGVGAE